MIGIRQGGDLSQLLTTPSAALSSPQTTASIVTTDPGTAFTSTTTPLATATTSTTSKNSSSQSSSNYSTGVLAGTAIGAAIGSAIIAILITWLILRSKNRSRSRRYTSKHRNDEKELTQISVAEVPIEPFNQGYRWEKYLPQPIDDGVLRLSAKTLFHQIELHVENFYSDVNRHGRTIPSDNQNMLDQFNSSFLPAPVTVLMQQGSPATSVIKHCLAKYIISNIDLLETDHAPFLSPEYRMVAATALNREIANKPGAHEAFSKWRILTAYLRPDAKDDLTPTATRDTAIQSCATRFSAAFEPWAVSRRSTMDRVQNLVEIMRNAAKFGDLIFSQASDFQYVWDTPSSGRKSLARKDGCVVVSPGLVKVTDEKCRILDPGQVIVSPVMAEI